MVGLYSAMFVKWTKNSSSELHWWPRKVFVRAGRTSCGNEAGSEALSRNNSPHGTFDPRCFTSISSGKTAVAAFCILRHFNSWAPYTAAPLPNLAQETSQCNCNFACKSTERHNLSKYFRLADGLTIKLGSIVLKPAIAADEAAHQLYSEPARSGNAPPHYAEQQEEWAYSSITGKLGLEYLEH